MEEKAIKKLSTLTEVPLEHLSQKERLKASRVRETMLDLKPTKTVRSETAKLQLIVPFSPILKSTLQRISYCLINRPKIPLNLNNEQIKKRLLDFVDSLIQKMALPDSFRNLFSKDGKKITTIVEIVEGDYTFFLTPLPSMDLLYKNTFNSDSLWRFRFMHEVINIYIQVVKLEQSLVELVPAAKKQPYKTLDTDISEKYSKVKEDIIDFISFGQGGATSKQLKSLYIKVKRKELDEGQLADIIGATDPKIDYLSRKY